MAPGGEYTPPGVKYRDSVIPSGELDQMVGGHLIILAGENGIHIRNDRRNRRRGLGKVGGSDIDMA